MANLSITASDVAPVEVFEQLTGPAAEGVDAGEIVRLDTSSGHFTLANATSAAEGRIVGVAMNSGVTGETITVMKRGVIYLGSALDSETFDEVLYASDTDGKIDDGDGSPTADYSVGRVVPTFSTVTPGKALHVDISM